MLTDIVAGVNGDPNAVSVTIPANAQSGDFVVVSTANRNNGGSPATVVHSMSVGTKVGQIATLSNYAMGAFYYQVQPGDIPGITTFDVTCSVPFNPFAVSVGIVRGASAVDAVAAPAAVAGFGATCSAPAVTTTVSNALILFAVGQYTSNTYSSATYTEIHEATNGTAGLALFSFLQAAAGSTGVLSVTASGTALSYGWTIAFRA